MKPSKIRLWTGLILIIFITYFPAYLYSQGNEIPITTASEEALSYFMEGRYKYENIQYATAAALFDEAISTDPKFAMAYLYRARCGGGFNIKQENIQKATLLLDNVTEGERHLLLFQKALDEGNQSEQKVRISRLLELFPSDKRVHFNAGLYYDFINDPPSALKHYLKAIQIDDKYAAAYNKIGYDFIDLGFLSAAEEAFKKYITLMPHSPNPYDSYAELLLMMGEYNESIEQYLTAFHKDSLFTQALSGVGHNYIFKGDSENARKYYHMQHERAVRINEKLDALMWIAVSYIHDNNIEDAINTLELRKNFASTQNLITDIIDSYNAAALILLELGHAERAKNYYSNAAELINSGLLSDDIKTKYSIEHKLNNCYWLIMMGEKESAEKEIKLLHKVVMQRDVLAEKRKLNFIEGVFAFYNNNGERALTHLANAQPDNPLTWCYKARSFRSLKYDEAAQTIMDRIRYSNQNGLELALARRHLAGR